MNKTDVIPDSLSQMVHIVKTWSFCSPTESHILNRSYNSGSDLSLTVVVVVVKISINQKCVLTKNMQNFKSNISYHKLSDVHYIDDMRTKYLMTSL